MVICIQEISKSVQWSMWLLQKSRWNRTRAQTFIVDKNKKANLYNFQVELTLFGDRIVERENEDVEEEENNFQGSGLKKLGNIYIILWDREYNSSNNLQDTVWKYWVWSSCRTSRQREVLGIRWMKLGIINKGMKIYKEEGENALIQMRKESKVGPLIISTCKCHIKKEKQKGQWCRIKLLWKLIDFTREGGKYYQEVKSFMLLEEKRSFDLF